MSQAGEPVLNKHCEVKTLGKITTITLYNSTRETIDTFIAAYDNLMQMSLQTQQPCLILLDFSHPDVGLTPYLRQEALVVMKETKNVEGYLAVVLATAFGRTVVSFLLRQQRHQAKIQFFKNPSEALTWLEKFISYEKTPS